MKRFSAAVAVLLAAAPAASAATLQGHDALALAALVGIRSPALSPGQRMTLARLLDGHAGPVPKGAHAFTVKADGAVCRASNVEITAFGCVLTFGTHAVNLAGRAGHELYATILEAGVPGDGAAGTIFEALHALSCDIDPATIAQRAGDGAACSFEPGPP